MHYHYECKLQLHYHYDCKLQLHHRDDSKLQMLNCNVISIVIYNRKTFIV
jgi:hypothetical protein